MVSSTVGSSTITGWNRRSSAGSFSIYWRYSSRVVAPMQCSSPGQHGLEQVARVHGTVCFARAHNGVQLVDEQDDPPSLFSLPAKRSSSAPQIRRGIWRLPPARPCPAEDLAVFQVFRDVAAQMRCANPSAMAVCLARLADEHGLFFVFRLRIRITLRISASGPITGTSFCWRASPQAPARTYSVRHRCFPGYRWSHAGCRAQPASASRKRCLSMQNWRSTSFTAAFGCSIMPSTRCSTETLVLHSGRLFFGSRQGFVQLWRQVDLVGSRPVPSPWAVRSPFCKCRGGKVCPAQPYLLEQLADKPVLLPQQGAEQMFRRKGPGFIFHRKALGGLQCLRFFVISVRSYSVTLLYNCAVSASDFVVYPLYGGHGALLHPDCSKNSFRHASNRRT